MIKKRKVMRMCCVEINEADREGQEKEQEVIERVRSRLVGAMEILIQIARDNKMPCDIDDNIDLCKIVDESMDDQTLFVLALNLQEDEELWGVVPEIIHVENSEVYGTGNIEKEVFQKAYGNLICLFVPVALNF